MKQENIRNKIKEIKRKKLRQQANEHCGLERAQEQCDAGQAKEHAVEKTE